jgi:hypothetical protein
MSTFASATCRWLKSSEKACLHAALPLPVSYWQRSHLIGIIFLLVLAARIMSALLENLRYRAESTQVTHQQDEASNTEGKFWIPRFDGNPNMLQEYAYRVKTKIAKEAEMSKDEVSKLGPLGLRLVEGLRGQAFRLAQQVDISVLASSAGPTTLLKTLNDNLKPRKEQEARELYAAGSREGGLLSRQHGEPMSSYVARRTSWWSTLQSLDQELKVPDVLLAEMTLANAGISEDQRLMIRTVLQGRVTTDTIATELLSQHPNIHERERRSGRSKGHGNKGSWRFPPRHKGGHRGFFSEDLQTGVDDWETGSQSLTGFSAVLDEERYDPEYDETLAYVADSQYDMSHDEDEDGFLVMNFALLCEDGLDLQNDEACALAAESLQLEHEAYLLRGHGKGKGHGGFQAQRQFDISGSVSFQERKARLAQLKARTECRRCGAKGHWSGDAACPKGQKKGGSKKHQGTSQTSTRPPQSAQGGKSSNKNAKPRVVYFSHRGDPGQGGFGYMAIKKEPNDDSSRPAGVCVPPPTSWQSSSSLRSSMTSSQPSASFADTLTNMVAAAAASNPLVSVPRAEEPARGRSIARDTHYYVQKTYSYSPTSEAESEPDQDHNLPVFLQRSAAEHVPSSPLPADSPTESSTAIMRTSDELDTALLLEALGAGSTEVVHGALQQLTDLEMEVDGEGIATAVMLPPNVQVINPQTLLSAQPVLPPIEALEERRMDQLTEWLDSHSPDDPRYAEASKERWNAFRPGHPLCTEADISNLERWRRNMLVFDLSYNLCQSHCLRQQKLRQLLLSQFHHKFLVAIPTVNTRMSPRRAATSMWRWKRAVIATWSSRKYAEMPQQFKDNFLVPTLPNKMHVHIPASVGKDRMALNGATRARHAARWPLGTIPIQAHMQPEKLLVQLLQRPNHLGTSTWTKWRRSSRPVWSLQE